MAPATIKGVKDFFGMTMIEFKNEWAQLTMNDKLQLQNGIGDGTLTY